MGETSEVTGDSEDLSTGGVAHATQTPTVVKCGPARPAGVEVGGALIATKGEGRALVKRRLRNP